MERHIQYFKTAADVQTALVDDLLGKPYLAYLEDERRIDWNTRSKVIPFSAQPLTFEIISAGTITWITTDETFVAEIEYSTDNGASWNVITSTTAGTEINVNPGDKIQFKGNYQAYDTAKLCKFAGTAMFNAYGNPLSIVSKNSFETMTDISGKRCLLCALFRGCTGLVDASNMVLAANVLGDFCYFEMFMNCTNLTGAPKLYATVLATSCYNEMLAGCTKLTTAPDLIAPTLVSNCYRSMFAGSTSLNYIKCLATNPSTTVTNSPFTQSWINGVSATGTFVKAPGVNWPTDFFKRNGIPQGWTVLDAE